MAGKTGTDNSVKFCSCRTRFRISSYPMGYFVYKRQVRPGNTVNTCPSCETDILQRTLETSKNSTIRRDTRAEKRRHEKFIRETEEDIRLLKTGEMETIRQIDNALRAYEDVLTLDQRGQLLLRRSRMDA